MVPRSVSVDAFRDKESTRRGLNAEGLGTEVPSGGLLTLGDEYFDVRLGAFVVNNHAPAPKTLKRVGHIKRETPSVMGIALVLRHKIRRIVAHPCYAVCSNLPYEALRCAADADPVDGSSIPDERKRRYTCEEQG